MISVRETPVLCGTREAAVISTVITYDETAIIAVAYERNVARKRFSRPSDDAVF